MKILITGAAGFIGFHSAIRLLESGHTVVGLDNLNNYYDIELKNERLELLKNKPGFSFVLADLSDRNKISELFTANNFDIVLHLGAQAGVRYSLENPFAYIDSNITGTLTILEGCRETDVKHLVYASSSSVYGANTKQPFSIEDQVDSPVSLYAATKKSDELMCQTYAHLYRTPITGLRFFTVYGPWGRPDMAYYKFADAILDGREIDVYNNGNMMRDFTYIDDIVDGIATIVQTPPSCRDDAVPHRVYNLGNNQPEKLWDMINHLERSLDRKAKINLMPMQPGDVTSTYADIKATQRDFGFSPKTSLSEGIDLFANWYVRRHSTQN